MTDFREYRLPNVFKSFAEQWFFNASFTSRSSQILFFSRHWLVSTSFSPPRIVLAYQSSQSYSNFILEVPNRLSIYYLQSIESLTIYQCSHIT